MGCAPQGQRTLKCYYQRTSGEPLYEQGRIRGFSRRFGDCSGSTVFAALPDRRLVLTPEIRAFLGFLPDSVNSFPSTRKCALALAFTTKNFFSRTLPPISPIIAAALIIKGKGTLKK